MEEGEILSDGETSHATPNPFAEIAPDTGYSPDFEWPGESAFSAPNTPLSTSDTASVEQEAALYTAGSKTPSSLSLPSLRFLVQNSTIIPKKQKLAVVDGYKEVQIGRDAPPPGTDIPKIRLKEMEVSKLHATVYWDAERREWAVVDMGSKHGTFLQSSSASGSSSSTGVRLSPPKMASIPRQIRHGDHLSIGGTTLLVHIHENSVPCSACSPQGNDEIPLFHSRASTKRKAEVVDAPQESSTLKRNPKQALTMLKRSLLSQHGHPSGPSTGSQYVDRSAKRRAMHPNLPLDPPHSSRPALSSQRNEVVVPPAPITPVVSAPSAPLATSNVGHKLLMKQGWQPGTSLGLPESEGVALLTPLEVNTNKGRAGLGMSSAQDPVLPAPAAGTTNWKERAKFKRWDSFKGGYNGSQG